MKLKRALLLTLSIAGSLALGIVASTLAADRGGDGDAGSDAKVLTADAANSKPDTGEGGGRGARGGEGRGEARGGRGRGRGEAAEPSPAAAPEPSQTEPAGRGGRGRGRGRGRRGGAAATEPVSGNRVDAREDRQQRRIDEGIRHGQLTPDEIATLDSQEKHIQTLEDSFKSDGTLTKAEAGQLNKALNDASLQIWAQRHDTEGNQKSVSRLGSDVISKADLTANIESGAMTHAQARQFLEDFRKMTNLKRRLSSDTLTDSQRADLTVEYNTLLNTYFQMK